MNQYHVSESAAIDAPPEQVYALLADYEAGHPAILPAPYFTRLEVLSGGRGAGTEIAVEMEVMGAKTRYRMVVTEPEPGRVLMEEDAQAGVRTTFTVDPLDGGKRSRVTIATTAAVSPGIKGLLEKLVTPSIARKIYREELAQLGIVIQEQRDRPGGVPAGSGAAI